MAKLAVVALSRDFADIIKGVRNGSKRIITGHKSTTMFWVASPAAERLPIFAQDIRLTEPDRRANQERAVVTMAISPSPQREATPMSDLMIYGAYGYSGKTIAAAAAKRGLNPILAGREARQTAAEQCPTHRLTTQAPGSRRRGYSGD